MEMTEPKRNSKSWKIAEQYRELLMQCSMKAGEKAGSVRKLMKMYHISSSTASEVMRHLSDWDILYQSPSRGTFIKHDPPEKLHLGYTGKNFCPPGCTCFEEENLRALNRFLRNEQIIPRYIDYEELMHPERAEAVFSQINALLLLGAYIDPVTIPQLKKFTGPIAVTEAYYSTEPLLFHQILPDFAAAFQELEPDIRKFERLIIFTAGHPNAIRQEQLIRQMFSDMRIETVPISVGKSDRILNPYRYFLHHKTGYDGALLIMLSGYFSAGLRNAFGTLPMPPVLEIDNFEKSFPDPDQNAIFTSIEPHWVECYIESIKLLKQQITHPSNRRYQIMIKPEIIVRKSFIPQIYLRKTTSGGI